MNIHQTKKAKVITFAFILFCCGAIFSVMLLTLIQSIVLYSGGHINQRELSVSNIVLIIGFLIFHLRCDLGH